MHHLHNQRPTRAHLRGRNVEPELRAGRGGGVVQDQDQSGHGHEERVAAWSTKHQGLLTFSVTEAAPPPAGASPQGMPPAATTCRPTAHQWPQSRGCSGSEGVAKGHQSGCVSEVGACQRRRRRTCAGWSFPASSPPRQRPRQPPAGASTPHSESCWPSCRTGPAPGWAGRPSWWRQRWRQRWRRRQVGGAGGCARRRWDRGLLLQGAPMLPGRGSCPERLKRWLPQTVAPLRRPRALPDRGGAARDETAGWRWEGAVINKCRRLLPPLSDSGQRATFLSSGTQPWAPCRHPRSPCFSITMHGRANGADASGIASLGPLEGSHMPTAAARPAAVCPCSAALQRSMKLADCSVLACLSAV